MIRVGTGTRRASITTGRCSRVRSISPPAAILLLVYHHSLTQRVWLCRPHCSVLNENERNTMGPRYTRCFDAIREGVAKYNPTIKLAGPEIVLGAQGACEPPTRAPYTTPALAIHWPSDRSDSALMLPRLTIV